jgi:hypothetical protein
VVHRVTARALLDIGPAHPQGRPLALLDGMNLNITGDAEHRQLADPLTAHRPWTRWPCRKRVWLCPGICLLDSPVTANQKELPVDVPGRHADAVVLDDDLVGAKADLDLASPRIIGVRHQLRQYGGQAAVEPQPEVLKYLGTDRQSEPRRVGGCCCGGVGGHRRVLGAAKLRWAKTPGRRDGV